MAAAVMTVYPGPQSADVNPYPEPEVIPYEPDHPDNPEQGPVDSSPPGPPLITPEEAWELAGQTPPEPETGVASPPYFVIGKCPDCGVVGGGHTPECPRYVAP